jgi:aspartate kinase
MDTVIQKYGGSSLSDLGKVERVADKIARRSRGGIRLAVVVSAMGDTTDELLEKAKALQADPHRRELDMLLSSGERMSMSLLSMALHARGLDAISLTGPQSGIVTDEQHTNANILEVNPRRVRQELDRGRVVIMAGFQGASRRGEPTTLGRGGSDTTAVVMAAALDADRCEIYSDVDGVYTADPRVVAEATRLDTLSYDEMEELARQGAAVLHPECVRIARENGVEIRAASTFREGGFTAIRHPDDRTDPPAGEGDGAAVAAIASRRELMRIKCRSADPRVTSRLLDALEGHDLVHDLPVVPWERAQGGFDVLVPGENLPDLEAFADSLRLQLTEHARHVDITNGIGSVSAIGAGAGVCSALRERLGEVTRESGIPVLGTYRTPRSLTCAVPAPRVTEAVRAFHRSFVEAA